MNITAQKDKFRFYGNLEGWLSIMVNTLLFAVKYWAGLVSGSVAMIADAWHTLSDSFSSVILLAGIKISGKPADKEHPFGHGRAELISALIIGFLLAIVGFNFLIEAVKKLLGHEAAVFGTIALIVTSVSIVVKEGMAQFAIRAGKTTGSKALRADGWHHRSDAISSVVILAGIFLGRYLWWIDGVLGILVALLIFYTAYDILKSAIDPLMGEHPDSELTSRLQTMAVEIYGEDLDIHHVHLHKYGRHTELTFHIRLPEEMSLAEAHRIADKFEQNLEKDMEIKATIHIEPNRKRRRNEQHNVLSSA
ncbi:MAG: cation diffusion facilitator family transporter [Bacteroidetes bacterium]|nr:cation diffusion facilitator family transporter [Bacteroidota bacterium]